MTALGIFELYKVSVNPQSALSANFFMGSLALGWGLFNVVEGLINHHFLQVHHVIQRSTDPTRFLVDLSFLAFGLFLIVTGVQLRRAALRPPDFQQ